MSSLRRRRRARRRVRIGEPDPTLTPVAGMLAVTELVDSLDVIGRLDGARGRAAGREGFSGRAGPPGTDLTGQRLAPVPGLAATTAAGLANRFSDGQWAAVETGLGDVAAAALPVLPAGRAAALCESVTIDLDTTGVEVYGRHKRGVAFNHQGQRVGRPARRARTAVAPSGAGSVRATVFVPGSTRRAAAADSPRRAAIPTLNLMAVPPPP